MGDTQTQSTEKNYDIPNFVYPFKKIPKDKYYEELAKEKHGNYLFSKDGFWHGGIHFNETLNGNNIIVIADGELVAFRINDKYMQNEDDQKAGKDQGFY
jgi:hypothetical protein